MGTKKGEKYSVSLLRDCELVRFVEKNTEAYNPVDYVLETRDDNVIIGNLWTVDRGTEIYLHRRPNWIEKKCPT